MNTEPNAPSPEDSASPESAEKKRIRIGSQRSATPVSPMKPAPPPIDLRPLRKPEEPKAPPKEGQLAAQKTFSELAGEESSELSAAVAQALARGKSPPTTQSEASTAPNTVQPAPGVPSAAPEAAAPAPAQPPRKEKDPSATTKPVPVEIPRRESDELEAELAEALGDLSLDEMMATEARTSQKIGQILAPETHLSGTVMKIDRENVFFALGSRNEGIAGMRQFREPPSVGQTFDVIVQKFDGEEGLYEVTVPGGSVQVDDWGDIDEGMVVEARVTGHNTGGLECEVNHIRGFIPASQVAVYRVENMEEFVGQKLLCVVTEAKPERRNLVLSRRAMLEREREENRKTFFEKLEPGQTFEGTVRKLMDFGAFVEIEPGVDGLIHISQLSWDRVKHPSEVLKEGQKVQVKIEKVDPITGKIGLSYRELQDNPWTNVDRKYPIGSNVKGVVSRLAQFGAFVKLEPGVEGLIHVSELAHHRVQRVDNVVKEGDEVEVKVVEVNPETQRIGLSLKATKAPPVKAADAKKQAEEEAEVDEPRRELAVAKRPGKLKGGTNKKTGGEGIGLSW
jgi:small subunit ribosomal protein S1